MYLNIDVVLNINKGILFLIKKYYCIKTMFVWHHPNRHEKYFRKTTAITLCIVIINIKNLIYLITLLNTNVQSLY